MDRRAFLQGLVATSTGIAAKAQQCTAIAPGVMGCHIEIDFPKVRSAYQYQECPEWCWAASLSMVFRSMGHPVDQKRIVVRNYGSLTCMPAQAGRQIALNLNTPWVDDHGHDFTPHLTAAYDVQAGVQAINNAIIVNELSNDRPILYCNTHHAMVIFAADYRPTQVGPQIDRIAVMDPWPYSPQVHLLGTAEMLPAHMGGQMTFLGTIVVSD